MKGVILYGPPASGKTSVAEALERLHSQYVAFRPLKAGGGRTSGYRMTTMEAINALDARGDIIWRHDRYGASYAVDCPRLLSHLAEAVPVVQLGQSEAVAALVEAVPCTRWLVVALICPRDIALVRLKARGDADIDERLRVWDATDSLDKADVELDTSTSSPDDLATQVNRVVNMLS